MVWVYGVAVLSLAALFAGCVKPSINYKAEARPPCQKPADAVRYTDYPLHQFLPLPLHVLEDKFNRESFDIVEAKATARGTSSAMQMRIQFPDCTVAKVKWRSSPANARGYNNDPRREIASYRFQKLFLEPEEYVVPVTDVVCVPSADIARTGLTLEPQIAETKCIFGIMAIWLNNITVVGNFLDPERFEKSVAGQPNQDYARQFANLNLFTYLIRHRDGRTGNFLVSTLPERPHTFSIDNSLAYEGMGNPRPDILQWDQLKVDKLPRDTVERLRKLSSNDLSRELGVVAEASYDASGRVTLTRAFSPNLDPQKGFRRQGNLLQIGLTNREISKIAERLRNLLERVDNGEIQLF